MSEPNVVTADGKQQTIQARAELHFRKGVADDEPFELDVDVTVQCPCGNQEVKRDQLYKPDDDIYVFCYSCGRNLRVLISTRVEFTARVELHSDSVLSVGAEASQGGGHG